MLHLPLNSTGFPVLAPLHLLNLLLIPLISHTTLVRGFEGVLAPFNVPLGVLHHRRGAIVGVSILISIIKG